MIYHVRNDGLGNDAADGLTEATAWATYAHALATIPAGVHVLKLKNTGIQYDVGRLPSSTTELLFTNNVSGIIFTRWDSDTSNPEIYAKKDVANNTFRLCCPLVVTFLNCDVYYDYDGASGIPPIASQNNSGNINRIIGCKFTYFNSSSTVNMFSGQSNSTSWSYALKSRFITTNRVPLNSTYQGESNRIISCEFFGFSVMLLPPSINFTFVKNLVEYQPSTTTPFVVASNFHIIQKNTFYIPAGNTTANRIIFSIGSTTQTLISDNIIVDRSDSNPVAVFGNSSSQNIQMPQLIGNNVYFGALYSRNLTNFEEMLGTSQALTSSPFISENPSDPNYLKIDWTNSDVLSKIKGKNYFDSNENIGQETLAGGGGETDPNKVLSTSLVVAGTIDPATVMDTNANGTLDKAKVMASVTGGTLPVNKVAPSAGGTMDLPALSSVDPLDTLEGQNGTMDVPALNKVAPTDTLRGQSGTMDLPPLNRVSPNATLEGVTGTQDLPALSSILETDSLEGQDGEISLDDILESAGGNYVEVEASSVDSRADNFGPNGSIVPTLDIDTEANLPEENTVEIGSPNFGRDQDKVPSFDPDFADPENVTENDTTNGVQGLIPLNKLAPSQGGTYLGQESNSVIPPAQVAKDFDYLNLGIQSTGEAEVYVPPTPPEGEKEKILLALQEALYSGVMSVSVAGRNISFRNKEEIRELIAKIQDEIAIDNDKKPSQWNVKMRYKSNKKRF